MFLVSCVRDCAVIVGSSTVFGDRGGGGGGGMAILLDLLVIGERQPE